MSAAADSDFLLAMAASSRQRDIDARALISEAQQLSLLSQVAETAPLVLADHEFDVIAEIKKHSPAEGKLDDNLGSPAEQALEYKKGHAAALSVLTEPERFAGSLQDLRDVVAIAGNTPVMRKDFLVSAYQVREARLAGASGVLLIAAMLAAAELEAMLETAFELDMFALVEAFDQADLDACLPVLERMGNAVEGNRCRFLLGINCRDLRSLQVDFDHFQRMAPMLPRDIPAVAESGLKQAEQARVLAQQGYRLALVGTTLMRSDNPSEMISAIRGHGAPACS